MGNDTGQAGAGSGGASEGTAGNGVHGRYDVMSVQQARELTSLLAMDPEKADDVAGCDEGLDGRLLAVKALCMEVVRNGCALCDLEERLGSAIEATAGRLAALEGIVLGQSSLEAEATEVGAAWIGADLARKAAELADQSTAAAERCFRLVEDLRNEVVTRRLRVVDKYDRTWITAKDGEIRISAPDDEGTWVGMSVDIDPYNGRDAGLWLSRRGFIVGSFTTENDVQVLDPTDPGAGLDIHTASGDRCAALDDDLRVRRLILEDQI